MNVKKITLLMLSAVMAFSFTGCSKKDSGEEQKKFDETTAFKLHEILANRHL